MEVTTRAMNGSTNRLWYVQVAATSGAEYPLSGKEWELFGKSFQSVK